MGVVCNCIAGDGIYPRGYRGFGGIKAVQLLHDLHEHSRNKILHVMEILNLTAYIGAYLVMILQIDLFSVCHPQSSFVLQFTVR